MIEIEGLGKSLIDQADLEKRAKEIRLLVCDVDGVLTDGGMYYGPDGEMMKKFDTRDGQGIALLRKAGVEVAFLTREKTKFAVSRAEKLGLRHCIIGALDKPVELQRLVADLGLTKAQVAYIGDDHWDIPVIPHVSLFFCPNDGFITAKDGMHVLLGRNGGCGAVRQAINYLLAAKS